MITQNASVKSILPMEEMCCKDVVRSSEADIDN